MSLKGLLKINIFQSILLAIIYLAYSCAGTTGEYLFRYAINALIKNDFPVFLRWCTIEILVTIVSSLLLAIGTYLFNVQIQQYLHLLRDKIVHHYYRSGNTKAAEMQNLLNSNMKILTDKYAKPWLLLLSSLLMVIMSIGVLFSMNWTLVLAVFVTCFIAIALPKLTEKFTARTTEEASQQNARFLNEVSDWFGGLSVLRRYHAIGRLKSALNHDSATLENADNQRQKALSTADIVNGIGNSIGQVGIIFWGGILFFQHRLDLGGWLAASGFASSIFDELWDIVESITKIKSTSHLRAEVDDLSKSILDNNEKAVAPAAVTIKGLSVSYGEHHISYPDFTVKAHDKVLLSGDSGIGKSTLFKAILGKMAPETGTITYQNAQGEVVTPNFSQIGYVAQDGLLFPDTIVNNITMFHQYSDAQINQAINSVELSADIAKFSQGLDTVIDPDRLNISGGQRQKIILARAELRRQGLLLLDEPTSAIDGRTNTKIINQLLASEQTVIVIGHNFSPELIEQFDYQIKLIR